MSLLRINNNISALNTQRNLNVNSFNLGKSLQKLSSGFRINVAADGPADLIISEQLRSQIGGLKAAIRNTQESINYLSIAEGALKEVSDLLTQARALAVHAANTGVVTDAQVAADQDELDNIVETISRINAVTRFGGQEIFSDVAKIFHVGEGATNADAVSITVQSIGPANINNLDDVYSGGADELSADPMGAIGIISGAISTVASMRGELGAFIKNTLQTNINSLSVALENVTATESYVRDANMAEETSTFTKNQILVQAGVSVLAQANLQSQSVLQLLG